MHKKISPKITALAFGILTVCFVVAFYAVAWQEPSQTPPGGNVPVPLNVGSSAQTKEGSLTIAAGPGDAFIIRNGGDLRLYNADNSGSALLYVDTGGEISTPGDLRVGSATVKGDGTISSNLNSDKLDDYHAADLMAASGGAGVLTLVGGIDTSVSCPAGWTMVLDGYWNCAYGGSAVGDCFCGKLAGYHSQQSINFYWAASSVASGGGAYRCAVCVK